jgi:hypothetical protein
VHQTIIYILIKILNNILKTIIENIKYIIILELMYSAY